MRSLFHLHRRQDLQLVLLIAMSLVLIGLHLNQVGQDSRGWGSGWRQVDLGVLQRRIEAGDLSDHEADWYRLRQGGPTERTGGQQHDRSRGEQDDGGHL